MKKNDKDLYDTITQIEREDNLRLIAQDERERQQFGDRSHLDVALDACERFNEEFEGIFDGQEQITETSDNSTNVELKVKYNLQDDILRLYDTEQNDNQNNIDSISKTLKKDYKR